jgi:hypothetical protein
VDVKMRQYLDWTPRSRNANNRVYGPEAPVTIAIVRTSVSPDTHTKPARVFANQREADQWAMQDLNLRHLLCKSSALAAELIARRMENDSSQQSAVGGRMA